MAYEKQNFETGQVLEAEHLNHIEAGIKELEQEKLASTELQSAINTALAQAKESGEFKGAKGDPGEPGAKGDPGYTPQKNVDYYTEADKTEMVSRVISALPTWNGGSY